MTRKVIFSALSAITYGVCSLLILFLFSAITNFLGDSNSLRSAIPQDITILLGLYPIVAGFVTFIIFSFYIQKETERVFVIAIPAGLLTMLFTVLINWASGAFNITFLYEKWASLSYLIIALLTIVFCLCVSKMILQKEHEKKLAAQRALMESDAW